MCVIAEFNDRRPDEQLLRRLEAKNKDGIGIAYFTEVDNEDVYTLEGLRKKSGRVVHFKKGISFEELYHLTQTVPTPFVVHFRLKTVGEVDDELTHPFPVCEDVPLVKEGYCDKVLFHNGTVKEWKDHLVRLTMSHKDFKLPRDRWSDSRAIAKIVHFVGDPFLNLIDDNRFLIMDANDELPITRKGGFSVVTLEDIFPDYTGEDKEEFARDIIFSNVRWR